MHFNTGSALCSEEENLSLPNSCAAGWQHPSAWHRCGARPCHQGSHSALEGKVQAQLFCFCCAAGFEESSKFPKPSLTPSQPAHGCLWVQPAMEAEQHLHAVGRRVHLPSIKKFIAAFHRACPRKTSALTLSSPPLDPNQFPFSSWISYPLLVLPWLLCSIPWLNHLVLCPLCPSPSGSTQPHVASLIVRFLENCSITSPSLPHFSLL